VSGVDLELWRGDVHLATVRPDGSWVLHIGDDRRPTMDELGVTGAKVAAKVAALAAEASAPPKGGE
jgi:hypothetical protein